MAENDNRFRQVRREYRTPPGHDMRASERHDDQ